MLIDIKKYSLRMKGVIHVGAHYGQEHDIYKLNGAKEFYYIEPNPKVYDELKRRVGEEATCFNVACGASSGVGVMYTSPQNEGQSNSLLPPAKHLEQHPDIKFNGNPIEVEIVALDSIIPLERTGFYNTLVIDVQGFEAEVLKGAKRVLEGIDYVYTEVNREETYKDCARIEDIDELLPGFERVEVKWVGIWGDALYVRKRLLNRKAGTDEFRPHQIKNYPIDNNVPFEEWLTANPIDANRVFLNIHWTAYYVQNGYGKDLAAIKRLQDYLDSLDRSLRYFTVVQYDDGILNDLSKLDIKVFSMSGKPMDFPLPLLSMERRITHKPLRYILGNFIGQNTHPIRTEILKIKHKNFFISARPVNPRIYTDYLLKSIYTLAPRGYGPTSFRIAEAVRAGSIPVYISDEFILPYGRHFNYGLLVEPKDVGSIVEILKEIDPKPIQENLAKVKDYFTYSYARAWIIAKLEQDI